MLRPELGARAAEMIEHHRHGRDGDQVPDRRDRRQVRVQLHVPVAAFHALEGPFEPRAPCRRVGCAAGREIEPDAAHPGPRHGVELALRRLVVDDGHAARIGAARLHAVERGRVVGAVNARRNDDHALHAKRLVQRRHFFRQRHFGRIHAPRKEREFPGIAVDMRMAIAGPARHFEAHRRRRLCRHGKASPGAQQRPAGD